LKSRMLFCASLLFLLGCTSTFADPHGCCQETHVTGYRSGQYFLKEHRTEVPADCRDNCVYINSLGQEFCFKPTNQSSASECQDKVDVSVQVKDAVSGSVLADVSVEFTLGDLVLTGSTDDQGLAAFTISTGVATIVVSRDGYISVTLERTIRANEQINVFLSPELAEGEHRLVVGWETSDDLDVYALQKDKTTGEIVCKTGWMNPDGCAGVTLDHDVYSYGPETITWTDADNDAYLYELYVHDYDQDGVAVTGASFTLYGETTTVEMSVTDGDGGDRYWVLGTFEPSVGTSSFSIMDTLQSVDPDTTASRRTVVKKNKPTK